MFFIASKVLYFIIQPLNWVIGLLLFAWFTKNEKRKQRCFKWSLILLLFFSNHLIYNLVYCAWEPDTLVVSEMKAPYDIGIILGGYSNFQIENTDNRHNFSQRGNRLTQATELYFDGKVKKLLLTGGSGRVTGAEPSEAVEIERYLVKIGIPKTDIIIEAASRNTRENATFSKAIIDKSYPKASLLLVTSAMHMPRSQACFEKVGLPFESYAVDYIGERVQWHPRSLLLPNPRGFYHWEVLIKEIVGLFVYKISGYA